MDASAPDDPNVAILRQFFDALDRDDAPALERLLDPGVVQTISGRSVLSGAYTGPGAVSALAARMRALLDRPPAMTPLIWLAAGPHAHVVARVELVRGTRTLATSQAMVFTLAAGRITAIRDYQDDQYAFDEFWDAVAQSAGGPEGGDDALARLPARDGPRPRTSEALPHQQRSQNAPEPLQRRLHEAILALPYVELRDSAIWGEGSRGYWLADGRHHGSPDAAIRGGEWGHMHEPSDGSLHVALTRKDAVAVEHAGWGELHPLARGNDSPYAVTMLYGPRTDDELATIVALVTHAHALAAGG